MHAVLSLLNRHARWALPAGVFTGIALPGLATLARPLLAAAVVATLTAAMLRLQWPRLAQAMRRPALPCALIAWLLVVSPLAVWFGGALIGLPPSLRLVLLLQACAPPIGSAAVFAMILGIDGALAMIGSVSATLVLPLTLLPIAALLLPEAGVQVDLAAFFARVVGFVAVPFVAAWGVRRALGVARLARWQEDLGGINVLMLVLFAVAVMDGVTARIASDPGAIALLLGVSCAATALLHIAGYLVFRRAGADAAFSAALVTGNRNMGLMLVITAGTAGDTFAMYVAIAQIPMYFAPLALGPFVRRSRRRAAVLRQSASAPTGERTP